MEAVTELSAARLVSPDTGAVDLQNYSPGIHEIPRILREFMKSLSETVKKKNLLELLVIL